MVANPQKIANEKAPLLRQLPVEFAEGALGYTLWSKQKQILRALAEHEKVAVKSCHGTGKSFVAAAALLWFLLTRRDSIVFTTAPTSAQVKNILWREVASHWGRLPDYMQLGEILKTEIQIGPKHYAIGRSTDRPDRIQGIHAQHLMVIADEAAGIEDDIFDVIKTFGAGGEYRELLIGNPTSISGQFYRAFHKPLGYERMTIVADETPNFTDEQVPVEVTRELIARERVDEWRRDHGEDSPWFQARVQAQFPEGDQEVRLIPLSWAEAATQRDVEDASGKRLQLGVDVARFGNDRTTVAGRCGTNIDFFRSKADETNTQENIAFVQRCVSEYLQAHELVGGEKLNVVIDETGVGAGVADGLVGQTNREVHYSGVNFGAAPTNNERFVCRRDEMHWDIRQLCEPGAGNEQLAITASGPEVERWQSQVASIEYSYTSRGKIKLQSKADMDGPSPDEADAVALAFTVTDSRSGRILTAGKRDNIDYYG